jgi:hypothetical protein
MMITSHHRRGRLTSITDNLPADTPTRKKKRARMVLQPMVLATGEFLLMGLKNLCGLHCEFLTTEIILRNQHAGMV